MSEPIGMSFEVGGTLPARLIKEFLSEINDELNNITGPTTEKELRQEAKWNATSNYGECDSLKRFCRKHNLSYIHTSEAKDEFNAQVCYWVPGMKDESSNNASNDGIITVPVHEVHQVVSALLTYAKDPVNALPLLIAEKNGIVKIAVEKGLKKGPKEFLKIIEKELIDLLPIEPKLPPFIIKE